MKRLIKSLLLSGLVAVFSGTPLIAQVTNLFSFDGFGLGRLRPVLPAVQFGFASAPPTPSAVRVTTLIDLPT